MKLIIDIPEEYKEQFIKNKCDDLFNSLATNEFGYVLRKSFETATLEVQFCEEAISRQAAINRIANTCFWLSADNWEELTKCINSISPIDTRPTGQWFIDERPESNREVVCSNCDQPIFKYHKLDFDYRPKYCPNCGSAMTEE